MKLKPITRVALREVRRDLARRDYVEALSKLDLMKKFSGVKMADYLTAIEILITAGYHDAARLLIKAALNA